MTIYHDGSGHNLDALREAARLGISDEHLLALALPEGHEVFYGGSDCETCGYNTDEVTWHFHANNSVSYRARFGCYGGAHGERATFKDALRDLPNFVDLPHLYELWREHADLLDAIKNGKTL